VGDKIMSKNLKELFDMKDKVVIVTGSCGLLGPEYVDILSEAGADVVIGYYDSKKRAEKLKEDTIRKHKTNPMCIYVDISSEYSVKRMVKAVVSIYGKIDVLVNNAYFSHARNKMCNVLEKTPLEEWRRTLEVNIDGVFLCCKHIGKQMMKQGYGNIVNISSIYGMIGTDQRIYENMGFTTPLSYATCKGAILNMTRWLASYWREKNIRVNTLSPGGALSDVYTLSDEFINNYSYRTILGRMANTWDYKGAMLFLCSDASEYMTGANLVVDGGWTAL